MWFASQYTFVGLVPGIDIKMFPELEGALHIALELRKLSLKYEYELPQIRNWLMQDPGSYSISCYHCPPFIAFAVTNFVHLWLYIHKDKKKKIISWIYVANRLTFKQMSLEMLNSDF